eukprot:Selendium_serpulae@DN8576_c0_g1_i1.p1
MTMLGFQRRPPTPSPPVAVVKPAARGLRGSTAAPSAAGGPGTHAEPRSMMEALRVVGDAMAGRRPQMTPERRPQLTSEEQRFAIEERFVMEKHLGAGGFGVVVEAVDKRTSQRVALKLVCAVQCLA